VLSLTRKVGELIRKYVGSPLEGLVKQLNQTLRGWGNYHRHVVSSETFSQVDSFVYEQLWRMIRRRHLSRSSNWLFKKYWIIKNRHWLFTVRSKNKKGSCFYQVIRLSSLGIKRYIKIKADANPYDPKYAGYIWHRKKRKATGRPPVMTEARRLLIRATRGTMAGVFNKGTF
jgi:RNA-directed DNA polymerase